MRTTSGGVKYYFSYTVQNPSPAYYDFMGEVDDSKSNGKTVRIPWSESASKNADSGDNSRRRRRNVDDTGDWNATASLYAAVVGAKQEQNDFELTVADEYESLACSVVAGKMVHLSSLALAIIILMPFSG